MPNKMSQTDFITKLKTQLPELKDFPDADILNKVFERRPELRDQVETNDEMAARAQNKAEKGSSFLNQLSVNPEVWGRHPRLAQIVRGVTSALPGAGSMIGGMALAPESLGMGAIPGMALGAGVGRGLQDIANQQLGLEETSPMQRAGNIGVDTAIAGLTPGIMEGIAHPIQTARMGAGALSNFEKGVLPPRLGKWLTPKFLEEFANGGKSEVNSMVKPPWQTRSSGFSDVPISKAASPNSEIFNSNPIKTEPFNPEQPTKFQFNPKGQVGQTSSTPQSFRIKATDMTSDIVQAAQKRGYKITQVGDSFRFEK